MWGPGVDSVCTMGSLQLFIDRARGPPMYHAIPVHTLCFEYGTNIYFRSAQVLDWLLWTFAFHTLSFNNVE